MSLLLGRRRLPTDGPLVCTLCQAADSSILGWKCGLDRTSARTKKTTLRALTVGQSSSSSSSSMVIAWRPLSPSDTRWMDTIPLSNAYPIMANSPTMTDSTWVRRLWGSSSESGGSPEGAFRGACGPSPSQVK